MTITAEQALEIAAAHHRAGDLATAEAMCRKILAVQPDHAGSLHRLGLIAFATGRDDEALELLANAIAHWPGVAQWHSDLGVVHRRRGQLEEAVACHERARALRSDLHFIHFNLGNTLHDLGRLEEAIASYRRGLKLKPDHADGHYNLALALLLLGRWEEGWKEHEWRWQCEGYQRHRRSFSAPQWAGTPMTGGTLLVHAEAGFGDTLQFVRDVPLVREVSGASRVIFECQSELARLLTQTGGWNAEVVARQSWDGAELPPFQRHIPMLSLPLVLGQCEPRRMAGAYLQADPGLRAAWRERLGPGFRVGLAWAGNALHEQDRRRSLAPDQLAPLLHVAGVEFVSLQVNADTVPAGVSDFTQHITDFADTAALMAELDLVIAVDTASVHLAGALGRPVWVLLPFAPDWRWGVERDDTLWYPAMRLFRQRAPGHWDEVMHRVAAALTAAQTRPQVAR